MMYETPLLVNVDYNSFNDYYNALSKTSKKNYKYCAKHNSNLIYQQIEFNEQIVTFFMDLWEDQIIHGKKKKWPAGYFNHLKNMAQKNILKLLILYILMTY